MVSESWFVGVDLLEEVTSPIDTHPMSKNSDTVKSTGSPVDEKCKLTHLMHSCEMLAWKRPIHIVT